jgi:hypothetical protein
MSQRYCHHINPAGVFCGGPPLKKRDYCYWHLHENGRRMQAARVRARSERVMFKMPVLDEPHAIQVAVMQLGEAISHKEIEQQSGRLLLSVLRLAASNVKTLLAWRRDLDADASIVVEDPTFEEQYGLPKDFDLSVDPEVAFPPPVPLNPTEGLGGARAAVGMCGNGDLSRAKPDQILRDAQTPIPGTPFQITADDMELMEVYEREGEQPGLKRAAELERKRKRRESRERRLYFELAARNRNIQLAAEKLVAERRNSEGTNSKPSSYGDREAVKQSQVEGTRKPPKGEGIVPVAQDSAAAGRT